MATMTPDELTALFDQQASHYDQQWSKMAPMGSALHYLTGNLLSELPRQARVLCVGSGTGTEILYLAEKFPEWHFCAVEPSDGMQAVFRRRASAQDILSRCVIHTGFLDSLPPSDPFDAALSFLVSHFITEVKARSQFFQGIADRLQSGGVLVSADLAGDMDTVELQNLLEAWFRIMAGSGVSSEKIEQMRTAYREGVAVLPPQAVSEIIASSGFPSPVHFFQTAMIHGWYAQKGT